MEFLRRKLWLIEQIISKIYYDFLKLTLNILIISLLKEKESVAYEILQKYHVDVEEVIYLLQEKILQ